MTTKEFVLDMMRQRGAEEALALRERSGSMDDTAIIAEEVKIPDFDESKDYSGWPAGAPVAFEGQVYKLLQPHNASYYPGSNPGNQPSLWSIAHTKDPKRAKPYKAPLGVSGLYMKDECCTHAETVYRSVIDNNSWTPVDYPQGWEKINNEQEEKENG